MIQYDDILQNSIVSNCAHSQFLFLVRSPSSNHENQMTEYRWVKLLDTTSPREILLKLFTNSQPEIISRLSHGDILHATRLICKSIDYNSITKRVLYLRPTIWSQYYIFVETNNEWSVPDEVDWIDSEVCIEARRKEHIKEHLLVLALMIIHYFSLG